MRAVTILISVLIGAYGASWYPIDSNTARSGIHYYKIYIFEASFYEAEDLCVAEGGHLASIHNQEENDLVYWLMTNNEPTIKESDQAWIGLRRKLLLWNHLAEDQKRSYSAWTWTDGSPVDYFEWEPAQPDNFAKSESCVQKHYKHGTWNDINCNEKMKSFVCKFRDFP